MGRHSSFQEILYYGSTRQQQYWENEKQTVRIVRERATTVWHAYRKQSGTYRPFLAKTDAQGNKRKGRRRATPLTGRSAEETIVRISRDHQLSLVLEQRLRRWMEKASGERVLAFLDPNQGGTPAMDDPGPHMSQTVHKTSDPT